MIETRYAACGEHSIAWQAIGDGPVDLVVIPGLVSHVEAFHDLPGYTALLAALGRFARVLVFDKRGNGLSDRIAEPPSLPDRVDDVLAVLDAAGSERAAVLGISEGGALAMYVAATHPARTRALALFGAFPRLLVAPDYPAGYAPARFAEVADLLAAGWGTGAPLMTLFGPSFDAGARAAAARCERLSATPSAVRALWRMAASLDVREALPRIAAPALIVHRADDQVIPVAAGRWLAAHVPGARYLELAGADHFPFAGDAAPVIDAIAALLDVPARTVPSPTDATAPAATPRARVASSDPHGDPDDAGAWQATSPAGGVSPSLLGTPHGDRGGARSLDPGAFDRLLAGALGATPFEVGRFQVVRALGAGGMGAVYLAEDRDLERLVAIKVMHRGDADAYRRFRREATAIAALSHPCVVAIHELGLDAAMPYLVMEYVRGGTVAALAEAPVPWPRAARLVAAAARGLGAAHALGIVHRDVKPANLLLPDRDGDEAKVADFGLAKLAGAAPLTRDGALIGTLGFVAPEQVGGAPVDARADVWALAATLYRLVTGRPHVDGTVAEIVARTVAASIPDPRAHAPGVPAALGALVARMGALDPADRPGDGAAAADALDAIVAAYDGGR